MMARLSDLMTDHPDEEIRLKAGIIHTVLSQNNNELEDVN